MKSIKKEAKKSKIFEPLFIAMLCIMVIAAAMMIFHVKKEVEASGIERAESAVVKAENLLTTGILSDRSAVTRFGGYIDWSDKDEAVNTMRSFVKEYNFAYAVFLDSEGSGYDQNGKPWSTETIPFESCRPEKGESCFVPFYEDKDGAYMTAIAYSVEDDKRGTGTFYVGVRAEEYSISARLEAYVEQGITYILDTSSGTMVGSTLESEKNDVLGISLEDFLADSKAHISASAIGEKIERQKTFRVRTKDGSCHFYMPVEGNHQWYLCGCISEDVITHESDSVLSLIKAIIILAIVLSVLTISGAFYVLYRRRREERRQAAESEMENAVLDALSEKSDSVLCVFDLEQHRLERVFRNSKRILGRESGEYLENPQYLQEICDLASPLLYERIMNSHIEEDEFWQIHMHHADTGKELVIRFTIKQDIVITDKKKYMFYWEDITQSVQVQESLRMAAHAAERANKSKSEFLSNMSHEIRTPMNAIMGMAEIMERNLENPLRIKDSIRKIKISTLHLLNIINDILDLSRIESGKIFLNNQKFCLSDLIDNVASVIRVQANGKNHAFDIHIHKLRYDALTGDWTRLNQILINVLSNSVKYTRDGGKILLDITESPSRRDGYTGLSFLIRDNGIGMSQEFIRQHVGKPFEQEQSEEHIKEGGTGLGLSIVYKIIKMMNADISIDSQVGQGTEIKIDLELKIDKSAADKPVKIPDGMRILVADGDAEVSEDVTESFGMAGIHVDCTDNGCDVLAMLQRAHEKGIDYHAVIADWKLPGLDGISLAKKVQETYGDKAPLILVAAYDWSEIIEKAQSAGIEHFIEKPLFPKRLYAMLELADADKRKETAAEHREKIQTGSIKVLLTEDNDLNREIAEEFLKIGGMEVDSAPNGQIAVDMFLSSAPGAYDLILMDLQMPVKDGLTATREIRAGGHPQSKSIPIIAMTANAFDEDVNRCLEAGMNAHIAKPLDLAKMLGIIEDILSRS